MWVKKASRAQRLREGRSVAAMYSRDNKYITSRDNVLWTLGRLTSTLVGV